jgi:hypothetical protein
MNMEEPLIQFDVGQLCLVIQGGCDRSTACKLVGITVEQLEVQMQRDAALRREVLTAEARPEVHHMTNILKASKDEKNWRSSIWWIERRDEQQECSADSPGWSTPAVVCAALERLAELIVAEIPDLDHRRAVLTRLLDVEAGSAIDATDSSSSDIAVIQPAEAAP